MGDLLSSPFLYLSNDEANMLKGLLAEESGIDDFSSNEFYEFFEQFNARSLVAKSNIREKLAEVARQELIQKPNIMTTCWKPMFNLLREEYHFNCKSHVFSYYDKVTPSNKKILKLLKSNSKEDLEKETLMYFKRYMKGLDGPSLRKLVQFLTGSDVVVVEKIDIAYYKPDNEFCRRPIPKPVGLV